MEDLSTCHPKTPGEKHQPLRQESETCMENRKLNGKHWLHVSNNYLSCRTYIITQNLWQKVQTLDFNCKSKTLLLLRSLNSAAKSGQFFFSCLYAANRIIVSRIASRITCSVPDVRCFFSRGPSLTTCLCEGSMAALLGLLEARLPALCC